MDKIKITQEQKNALSYFISLDMNLKSFIEGKDYWKKEFSSLTKFSMDEFARLLYRPDSYAVVAEFKVNDLLWDSVECRVVEIRTDGEAESFNNHPENYGYATDHEKEEYSQWLEIGRDVREFRYGDILLSDKGIPYVVDKQSKEGVGKLDKTDADIMYENGNVIAIYPSGSKLVF